MHTALGFTQNSKTDMAISLEGLAGITAPFKGLLKTLAPVNVEPISLNSWSFFPRALKWTGWNH